MNLDDVTVEIRPRRSWESVDLGFRLARSCAGALWGAWVVTFYPVALTVCFVLRDDPWMAALIVWWFKPWFDRVALHVLSRAVFGSAPRVPETLRALPSMFRRGAFASVLHMRFDAARSLNLALWQLEELPWARWRRRVRLLETPVRRCAGWFTVVCLYLEATVVVSALALAYWMIPPSLLDSADLWLSHLGTEERVQMAWLIGWVSAVCVVEPLYVAGGFGLYLNRRTELEAWDVEIAFRRMCHRQLGRIESVAA